jgi:hypothetical protein
MRGPQLWDGEMQFDCAFRLLTRWRRIFWRSKGIIAKQLLILAEVLFDL